MKDRNLTLNEYQRMSLETDTFDKTVAIFGKTTGLTEEAGEVAGKVKRIFRGDYPIMTDSKGAIIVPDIIHKAIAEELGDTLWYVATLASEIGYTLEEIAVMNYQKCKDRQQRNVTKGEGDHR